MENYKKVITKRIYLLGALVALAVGLGIFDVFFATPEIKGNEIFEFQCGLTAALGFLAIVLIMQYIRILKNDKELAAQYNKESDERMKAIRAKAGMPMSLIYSILMIVIGLVMGYSNVVAFYTLVAAAIGQMIISCIIKFVYMKIM